MADDDEKCKRMIEDGRSLFRHVSVGVRQRENVTVAVSSGTNCRFRLRSPLVLGLTNKQKGKILSTQIYLFYLLEQSLIFFIGNKLFEYYIFLKKYLNKFVVI